MFFTQWKYCKHSYLGTFFYRKKNNNILKSMATNFIGTRFYGSEYSDKIQIQEKSGFLSLLWRTNAIGIENLSLNLNLNFSKFRRISGWVSLHNNVHARSYFSISLCVCEKDRQWETVTKRQWRRQRERVENRETVPERERGESR